MYSFGATAMTVLLFMFACTKDEGIKPTDDVMIEQRGLTGGFNSVALIGLSTENELVNLMSGPPVRELSRVPIIGLKSEESIIAIDTRPRNKQLFGVSNFSILYQIDPLSGIVHAVSGVPLSPAINGTTVGFDFNPLDDMIRLITDEGQALRISPTTGAVVGVDALFNTNLIPINSIAFSSTIGTTKSGLYDLDPKNGNLYRQSSSNGGSLVMIGSTGFLFSGEGGFEITNTNIGFTVQYGRSRFPAGFGSVGFDDITQDSYRLLNINLKTGKTLSFGKVSPMIGLTVK